jgi:ribosomal protein S18 acetylase RimI-like enzyme
MNIEIQRANLSDLSFIEPLYVDGISGGHFNSQPGLPISRMLQNWLKKQSITRAAVRSDGSQLIEEIPINFRIAKIDGAFAGFLITSPETSEKTHSIDIYLLGVAKAFRNKGVATYLVRYAEENSPSGTTFYARCYPKSTWAISLLQKLGYKIESISTISRVHYFRKM